MNKFDFETIADSIDYGFGTDFSMEHTMMAWSGEGRSGNSP